MTNQDPNGASMKTDIEDQRITLAMQQFAADRSPLVVDVNTAKDPAERATKLKAVTDYDAKRLPPLVALAKDRTGPDRWKHPDPKVVDAVLAALQMQMATEAMKGLDEDPKTVKDRNLTGHDPKDNWCGYYATEQYSKLNFAKSMARDGFSSTLKVMSFFTYKPEAIDKGLYPNFIKADDGSMVTVPEYHRLRKSERKWLTTAELMGGGDLDIRPGDIVTLAVASATVKPDGTPVPEEDRHREKPEGDHIQMVQSYDPKSRVLVTIGGNDGGYVVRNGAPSDLNEKAKADREAMEAATGKSLQKGPGGGHVGVGIQHLDKRPLPTGKRVAETHIAGVGRPSLVDFEDHEYSRTDPAAKGK